MKQLAIITTETEAVKDFILNELGRSATVFTAKGAYSGDAKEVITVLVSQKESIRLNTL